MSKKKKGEFNIGELVVYPKHGVGEIKSISTIEVSKIKTKCYIIQMEQAKLLIRVPLDKQKEVGLRKIASKKKIEEVFEFSEMEQKIADILDEYIQPAVESDGGFISLKSFENGVVSVILKGACSGCPSSSLTLKQGIEGLLKQRFPEQIKDVVAHEE